MNFLTNMSKIDDVSVAQVAVSPDNEGCHWLKWIARGLLIWLALPAFAFSESLPVIVANQNHAPAGILRDGLLSVHLEIAKGDWHPEADNGMALAVYAFGEAGHPLQNPGTPHSCAARHGGPRIPAQQFDSADHRSWTW